MTIDSAYISDLTVGDSSLRLSENTSRSSGATQQTVPPLRGVDTLTEVAFICDRGKTEVHKEGVTLRINEDVELRRSALVTIMRAAQ
jgi:hypothetical protein